MTGVTGPTGPTVTANYLAAGRVGPDPAINPVPPGGIISLATFDENGNAISNNNGSITLAPNQTFSVVYKTNNTDPGSAILRLNGTNIGGSNAQGPAGTLAGNTIVSTGALGGTLTLNNFGPATNTFGSTTVSVIKLA
ncbi:hypothetical protein ACE3NQ_29160 [Paenibacillus terreus]|uniref:BclA C-terminal domain-containing protein n=1 Tax=Paenibacillus terreus TaxID=1387834 RepID=A0ABV5BHE7_9BACL